MKPLKKLDYSEVQFTNNAADIEPMIEQETEKWELMRTVVAFDRIAGNTYYGTDSPTCLQFWNGKEIAFVIVGSWNEKDQTHPVKLIAGNKMTEFNYHPFGQLSGINTSEFTTGFKNAFFGPEIPIPINPIFESHISPTGIYDADQEYGCTIEKQSDRDTDFWELSVYPKVEGFDLFSEDALGQYQYQTKEEAIADIKIANDTTDIYFSMI